MSAPANRPQEQRITSDSDDSIPFRMGSKAAALQSPKTAPAENLIDDLMAVMIGDGMLNPGRNRGPYFVGFGPKVNGRHQFLGSEGFVPDLKDEYFQIQHAFAGVIIGYRNSRLTQYFIRNVLEQEAQDQKLYDATFALGRELDDSNYTDLADNLRKAICHANSANNLIEPGRATAVA